MRPSGPHLYKRVCPSVGPSIRWSIRPLVRPLRLCKNRVSRLFLATLRSYIGFVSTRDNRVINGPLGRSLHSFAHTARSTRSAVIRFTSLASLRLLHSACFAPLASLRLLRSACFASLASLCSLALFTGSLTHFAHSLVGQLKFMNMCSC